jgi:hypothetical protein
VATGTDQKLRLDLLKDPDSKIGRGGVIHGDGNHSATCAAQKRSNPRGRIRTPDYDAIAFANSTRGKFASELERKPGYIAISPAYKPVSDALGIGLFIAEALEVSQIIGDAGSHRLSVNHLAGELVSTGVGIAFGSNSTVTGNTVVDFSAGIWSLGASNTIKSNQVSLAGSAIILSASSNVVENNFLFNLNGGAGISFNCTGTGNTVINNFVNDAFWGIVDPHGTNTVSPNSFFNVKNLISGPC